MWIDGKCFNIKPFKSPLRIRSNETIHASEVIINKTEAVAMTVDVEIENEIDVTTDENGKLYISFQLPSIYYIKLNKFNADINALSQKTQTVISFPKHGKDGQLIIKGEDKSSIQKALNDIHSVVGAIRDQSAALQFISIPLLSEEIKSNFEKFKNEILSEKNIKGMDESIFQSSLKLHLTVIVFALTDEREKLEAINTLEEYKTTVLCPLLEGTGPLKIHVAGIECMNDNYRNADILYANAKIINETEEVNLQKIVNDISNYFYERGLVKRYQENVKLHMTLINTKYRKVLESPTRRRWNKRESFDATNIMEKYRNIEFGECNLDSIHLSLISSKGEDGFYKPLSVIKI
ncbi:hypothetical protein NQ314_013021 [Rhamnusium bicolor]|uniref:A-kinase anchor protein 7-like phosphoesterase domain-containing protein n=1 Tax=Rhamnusium bicolor TaxID=1586634 RepID=A0AAV8X8V8_9CUCU|nr:hypothetical protein NQ314_013021 [Rhamnusium bicolor]